MLYSSAEIFTWKKYGDRTVLLLYGGMDETHEVAFVGLKKNDLLEGNGVRVIVKDKVMYLNWAVTSDRKVLRLSGALYVYLLSMWLLFCPGRRTNEDFKTGMTPTAIGYSISQDHHRSIILQRPRPLPSLPAPATSYVQPRSPATPWH